MGRSGPALRQSRLHTPSSAGQSQAANMQSGFGQMFTDWLVAPHHFQTFKESSNPPFLGVQQLYIPVRFLSFFAFVVESLNLTKISQSNIEGIKSD